MLFFSILFACQEPVDKVQPLEEDFKTELGAIGQNPFSSDNMKAALESVLKKTSSVNGRTLADLPSTTHNYVRFAPQNEDQLITLHNYGYDLYDVPLDQDITNQGEFYQDPSLPPTAITYQYTLVPSNYSLPTTVPYTVLYQVFLFDETAGDQQDPDWDPWAPDPGGGGGGYCYDEYGQAYICGSEPRIYLRVRSTGPEDLYKKVTLQLIAAGVNLKELYNEAMKLSGHPEETIPDESSSGRTQSVNPYGYVRVTDNSTGNNLVPVKNVTVKTRRWFKLATTQTDASGYFYINKAYRQKANIVIKFRNDDITIRGISGALKFWEYAQALEKEAGLFSQAGLQGVNINLTYNSNADTYGALQWAAAHCINTLYEAKQYVWSNGIVGSYPYMNVWISSAVTQAASAPMLRSIAGTSAVNNTITYLLPGIAPAVKKLVENWLPDVTMRLQGAGSTTRNADRLSNTFYHEFAHGMHYDKVGNNYWASYIAYIVLNGGYGNKTTSGSGRVAVGESWGNFIGGTFNRTKYSSNQAIFNFERDFLENQKRSDTYSIRQVSSTLYEGWIPWGMLHDLTDTGEPTTTLINDQVNGYTLAGIFRGFHSGSTTVQELKNAILVNNSNLQSTQVNTLVTSYGY
ncbi:MAG: hypothetical protein JNM78_19875 [Cyclobacteriaceae bacterium]|nr:hypothetical protein [Cyclobacteriaceae bacterium]